VASERTGGSHGTLVGSMLTDAQIERYSRQIIVPEVGGRGQEQLLAAAVVLGGRGSTAASLYLVAAGIGTLTLIDSDTGDDLISDLAQLNPDCHIARADAEATAVAGATVVVETSAAADAPPVLYDRCRRAGRPLVWGAAHGAQGFVTVLAADGTGACAACVQRTVVGVWDKATDAVSPLADLTAAFVGSQQAAETIKLVLGMPRSSIGAVLLCDMEKGAVEVTPLDRDPACRMCAAITRSAGL
jgi:molybdopterin/thiamine biosynthesis adenylyltransferase